MKEPKSATPVEFASSVQGKIEGLLHRLDGLREPIRGMLRVLQRRPKDEQTVSIDGRPGVRYIARKPRFDPIEVPGVTLLYRIEENRVVVWGIRIKTVDGEEYAA